MFQRLLIAARHGGGRRGLAYLLILATATGGALAVVLAVRAQRSAPVPPASAAGSLVAPVSGAGRQGTPAQRSGDAAPAAQGSLGGRPTVERSVPVAIDIPAIGVHSAVVRVGKTSTGALAVPQPGPNLNKAAWYDGSVTPGQDGPAVIEGHVDTVQGPSVFFRLGGLRPGNMISVKRADSTVAHFAVTGVRSYASHAQFPETAVFGADLAHSTLRLITCSNFDSAIGHYVGNTVVFASLVRLTP